MKIKNITELEGLNINKERIRKDKKILGPPRLLLNLIVHIHKLQSGKFMNQNKAVHDSNWKMSIPPRSETSCTHPIFPSNFNQKNTAPQALKSSSYCL